MDQNHRDIDLRDAKLSLADREIDPQQGLRGR